MPPTKKGDDSAKAAASAPKAVKKFPFPEPQAAKAKYVEGSLALLVLLARLLLFPASGRAVVHTSGHAARVYTCACSSFVSCYALQVLAA